MKKNLFILISLFICALSAIAQPAEVRWLHRINSCDSRAAVNYNKFMSNSEAYLLIGIPVGMGIYDLVTRDRDHLDKTLGIAAAVVSTYAVQLALKQIVKRDRPFEKYPGYIVNRVPESGYSFPSNHTGGAFALATSLTLNYPKWYVIAPAYVWACAVGYSRMQLGVHYPTDVLAGAVIGSACAWGCYELQRYLTGKRKENSRLKLNTLQAYR
ncbi:MAG: phosphatase PAP2 family protein [Bacteroidales bacterium]